MSSPFPEPMNPAASRSEVFLTYLDHFRSEIVRRVEALPMREAGSSRLPS